MNELAEYADATPTERGPLGRSGSEPTLVSGFFSDFYSAPGRCSLEGRAPAGMPITPLPPLLL